MKVYHPQKSINHLIIKTLRITVTGLIQGVGFRPFVYRTALKHGLTGWVQNTNENVRILVTGSPGSIADFLFSLEAEAPPAAMIENIHTEEAGLENFSAFVILKSSDVSDDITEISPDIAVCTDCLNDMEQAGNRPDYPFVNCTNCGPRFTIIRELPYDRSKTTMQTFPMCQRCRNEYENVTDRRFHAQPIACSDCGPQYELFSGQRRVSTDISSILGYVAGIIGNNGIAVIKGMGGMHLACDAFSEKAVRRLRELKNREGKPLAVMFRDAETAGNYVEMDDTGESSLRSWRRPIVLLNVKIPADLPPLAPNINSGLKLLGIMLPYMPFHYQLFRQIKTSAIVLTSGNFSNDPILISNELALKHFSSCTDAVLLHNRDIFNRTDDSVVRIMGGKERIFRRSRGYVPNPVRTTLNVDGIVAFGAELTNCFCVGKGNKAFLSQHIGDLKSLETTLFYEQTLDRFMRLFRIKLALQAVDMHPDYISTKTAARFGQAPLVAVQHHHAHIASCMAEHNIDEKVIGVAFDGTGYGDDGNIWGSEFFVCDFMDYTRISHFGYLPLPGGDAANEEPWRMAVSWLYKVFGDGFSRMDLPVFSQTRTEDVEMLVRMIGRKVNCPLTSGAGRFFDAVASILGLCQVAAFPAQGPMLLESILQENCRERYDWLAAGIVDLDLTLHGIVNDLDMGVEKSIIATKFHNTIISVIFEMVIGIRADHGINKVVLSGGVFQNKYLLEGTETLLKENNFEVFSPEAVPANDGGIALGQIAIAAKRRELKCV